VTCSNSNCLTPTFPSITNHETSLLPDHLAFLKLAFFLDQHRPMADQAAREAGPTATILPGSLDGEVQQRQEQSLRRRVRLARLPWVKTLEQFQWSWPKKINRAQIQHLFALGFRDSHNVLLCGGAGLANHLAIALAHTACVAGHSPAHFCRGRHQPHTAQHAHRLKARLSRAPGAADPCPRRGRVSAHRQERCRPPFQVLSARYERASTIITTNKAYKDWVTSCQRCRPHLRHARPLTPPCRDHRHRRQELPHEPHRRPRSIHASSDLIQPLSGHRSRRLFVSPKPTAFSNRRPGYIFRPAPTGRTISSPPYDNWAVGRLGSRVESIRKRGTWRT
jgi:hypothetical protein